MELPVVNWHKFEGFEWNGPLERSFFLKKIIKPNETVFDFGAGQGRDVYEMYKHGCIAIGVDRYYDQNWRHKLWLYIETELLFLDNDRIKFISDDAFNILDCNNYDNIFCFNNTYSYFPFKYNKNHDTFPTFQINKSIQEYGFPEAFKSFAKYILEKSNKRSFYQFDYKDSSTYINEHIEYFIDIIGYNDVIVQTYKQSFPVYCCLK